MRNSCQLRWLGTAGWEFRAEGTVLAVDPFFTRPGLLKVLFTRPRPDAELIASMLARCDFVLLTHPHYDHLMDVPEVIGKTGAQAYGSSNSCELLAVLGVLESKINTITAGNRLQLGDIQVEVHSADHRPLFGMRMATGPLSKDLRQPLRAMDYRMDECFSFSLRMGERSVFICSGLGAGHVPPCDVLLVAPYGDQDDLVKLLEQAQPRLVIPNHWDDFLRPLTKPLRMLRDPSNWLWPPLRRVDLTIFERIVSANAPRAKLLVPQMLEMYDLEALLPR